MEYESIVQVLYATFYTDRNQVWVKVLWEISQWAASHDYHLSIAEKGM